VVSCIFWVLVGGQVVSSCFLGCGQVVSCIFWVLVGGQVVSSFGFLRVGRWLAVSFGWVGRWVAVSFGSLWVSRWIALGSLSLYHLSPSVLRSTVSEILCLPVYLMLD
jgi:hypothetical protein